MPTKAEWEQFVVEAREAQRVARLFAGLSYYLRVQILDYLAECNESSILHIAQHVSCPTSEVGYHLRKLLAAGLVQRRLSGKRLLYRLSGSWVSEVLAAARTGFTTPKQSKKR